MNGLNKTLSIPYGSTRMTVCFPPHTVQLQIKEPQKVISQDLFATRLHDFFQKHPLDLSQPILIVADKTRLCGYPEYLPRLLQSLKDHGMDKSRLRIIIAYGTHARQTDHECLQAYGKTYNEFLFVHHDCNVVDDFVDLALTARGTPIRLRRDLLDASAVITMGPICHHYFAGFGGGRKLIFPGCGERKAIYTNHSLYLDRIAETLAQGCRPGALEGNPLAQDLFEIEAKFMADLSIHGILNSHGELCDLLPGQGRDLFLAACAVHSDLYEVDSPQFDTVVASCGGYPKDINFIQSHKAIHNAALFVRDGGQLIVYTECRDDIGSRTFTPWFKYPNFAEAFARLSSRYEGNGGTALAMMTKTQRIRIALVTTLSEHTCRLIGVERWPHDRVCAHLAGLQKNVSTAFIPNAGLLVRAN